LKSLPKCTTALFKFTNQKHLLLALMVALSLPSNAFAISYQIQLLDFPDSRWTGPGGINNSGEVVGAYLQANDQTGAYHGFTYRNGVYNSTPDYPGAHQTILRAINNSGAVVGTFSGGGSFVLQNGSFNSIGYGHIILGNNDSGVMVGRAYSGNAQGDYYAARITAGVFENIDLPGTAATQPNDINNQGQIVGSYSQGGREHGFLLSGSSYVTVDYPGAFRSGVLDINDSGDMVGFYQDVSGNSAHGFIFSNGLYETLDIPWFPFTTLTGINNAGQIVGTVGTGQRDWGFLATPCHTCRDNVFVNFEKISSVPEPSSLLLLGSGLAGLAAWRRNQYI
jgi:uncharacterized membrane protein